MPQPKKDPSVRARRNKASTAARLVTDHDVAAPQLPERERSWNPLTLEWWSDVWASPMAGEYHSSDRHALFILAELVDQFWTNPTQQLAMEIRQQRQSFGLTPYDRRRLEWTIESAEESKDRGRQRRERSVSDSRQATSRSKDPRLVLVS